MQNIKPLLSLQGLVLLSSLYLSFCSKATRNGVAFLRLCLPLYLKIVVDNYINFMIFIFWLYLIKFLFNLNPNDMPDIIPTPQEQEETQIATDPGADKPRPPKPEPENEG